MFEILTQNVEPYSHLGETYGIERKVANNEQIRPKLDETDKKFVNCKWYIQMMKRAWVNDPHQRPELKNMLETVKYFISLPTE